MSWPIDLGQSSFKATGSLLELRFSAIANLSQVGSGDEVNSTIKLNHWRDLQSLWITEAPVLELRIFVNVDPVIEAIGSTFVAILGEELCKSMVWPDLGFDIILKGRFKSWDSIASGTHCLSFGMCRRNTMLSSVNSKSIPPVLRNPMETHIPSDVPTACLASIDVHLKYEIRDTMLQAEAQLVETLKQIPGVEARPQKEFYSMHNIDLTGNIGAAAYAVSTIEGLLLPSNHPFDGDESMDIDHQKHKVQIMSGFEQISPQLLNLFEFGLQKLMLPGVVRNRSIKTISKNELQNLSLLAPAIFNPDFREAMKQRAASISTIKRSLISMLQNSNHPVIQNKLSATLRDSTNPGQSPASTPPTGRANGNPLTDSLKATMESSLWNIAQHRLPKNKALKKPALFFASNHQQKQLPIQTDDDIILSESSDREFGGDDKILELDSDALLTLNSNYPTVFDELCSDDSSMLTFQEFDSTQTTEMTEVTQTSIDTFSQATECLPDVCDDVEILLSDEILMDEGLDGHEFFEDMDSF